MIQTDITTQTLVPTEVIEGEVREGLSPWPALIAFGVIFLVVIVFYVFQGGRHGPLNSF